MLLNLVEQSLVISGLTNDSSCKMMFKHCDRAIKGCRQYSKNFALDPQIIA